MTERLEQSFFLGEYMKKFISNKEKTLLLVHFLLITAIAVFQTVYPMYVSSFIEDKNKISGILWLLTFLIGGKVVLSIIDIILNNGVYWSVYSKLRLKLVNALLDMDYRDILKKDIGELTQTVENDTEQLVQFYLVFLTTLIKNILFVLGVLVVGFVTNIWVGIVLSAVLVILFLVFRHINHLAQNRWEETKREYENFFGLFSKINSMMDELVLLRKDSYLKEKLLKTVGSVFRADFLSSLISYALWISTILGFGFVKVIVLLFGVLMNINLGVVYLFVYYIDLLNDPLEELRVQLENIPSTMESEKRVSRLLDIKSAMTYGMQKLEKPIEKIEFVSVDFSYGTNCIFKKFNVSFTSGRIYGLIGKSGSGKSTLINLMARLYDKTDGIISVNGLSIAELQKGELTRQMEYIGQNEVTEISRYEIVDPEHKRSKKEIEDFLGFSLDENLSMGQFQYLFLCRALLTEKSVLMLDEIFTHIDAPKVKKAFQIFKDKKQLVIIITHEREVMNFCDELIDLEEYSYAV